MKPELPLISGDEEDALTPARKNYNWRAGQRKRAKHRYNRRCRRLMRQAITEKNQHTE